MLKRVSAKDIKDSIQKEEQKKAHKSKLPLTAQEKMQQKEKLLTTTDLILKNIKKRRAKMLSMKVENFCDKMHAKSIIVDDEFIVSDSRNLTKARNDENIIIQNKNLVIEHKRYF